MHSFNQLEPPSNRRLELNQLLISITRVGLTTLKEGFPWFFISKGGEIINILLIMYLYLNQDNFFVLFNDSSAALRMVQGVSQFAFPWMSILCSSICCLLSSVKSSGMALDSQAGERTIIKSSRTACSPHCCLCTPLIAL